MITYKKYFNTLLKYLPIIIAYTLLNELLGYFIRYTDYFSFFSKEDYNQANDIIYNFYDVIFFGYFYYVFWKAVVSKKFKNWILIGATIAFMTYVISAIFQNPFLVSLYYANAIACWILVFFIALYLIELNSISNWKSQIYNLMFWLSIGLAVFHLFFPIVFTTGYLNYEVWQAYNLRIVIKGLIVIMYTLFCIGFIVCRRRSFNLPL